MYFNDGRMEGKGNGTPGIGTSIRTIESELFDVDLITFLKFSQTRDSGLKRFGIL